MRGLPIEYRRYAMEKTGAVADEPSTLIFERLKEAVESRIMAAESAERMAVLEEVLNVQLVQELRQQRNELDRRREGRLLDLAVVQSPAEGYEDWQNGTRAPFVP